MDSFTPDFTLEGGNITDEESFYTEIGLVCNFPDCRNLETLHQCLGDLARKHPGAQIWWANVHPYLKDVATRYQASPDKIIQENLLEQMKKICEGHGLRFCA